MRVGLVVCQSFFIKEPEYLFNGRELIIFNRIGLSFNAIKND